jgi:single-strand DNA-binding protein
VTIECAVSGNLGRDAELKTSKAGRQYLKLAVRAGDKESGSWVSISVFDDDAIAKVDKLTKGTAVYVEGSLSLDEWTAKDGTKRQGLSVMARYCRVARIGRNGDRPPTFGSAPTRQRRTWTT